MSLPPSTPYSLERLQGLNTSRFSLKTKEQVAKANQSWDKATTALIQGKHIAAIKPTLEEARNHLLTINQRQSNDHKIQYPRDVAASLGKKTHKHHVQELTDWWKKKKTEYHWADNGVYPLRDIYNKSVKVEKLTGEFTAKHPDRYDKHDMKQVKQFLFTRSSPFTNKQTKRAWLYGPPTESNQSKPSKSNKGALIVRKITEADLTHPGEKPLVGQNGVFAAHDIPQKTCLGVYGGTLLTREQLKTFKVTTGKQGLFFQDHRPVYPIDDSYLMSGSHEYSIVIDGSNILSRINTQFVYDAQNSPISQASELAYNVERVDWKALLKDGRVIDVFSLFSNRPIRKDEQLRLDYGYPPTAIQARFANQKLS